MTIEEAWKVHHRMLLLYGNAAGSFPCKDEPDHFERVQAAVLATMLAAHDEVCPCGGAGCEKRTHLAALLSPAEGEKE
jgi:hypothetical protein